MSAAIHDDRAGGVIERVVRRIRVGDEPSLVAEYARFTVDERLQMFLHLRHKVIRDRYGTDPGLERVYSVARRTSVDDLLINKRASGRPKDLADIDEFERRDNASRQNDPKTDTSNS